MPSCLQSFLLNSSLLGALALLGGLVACDGTEFKRPRILRFQATPASVPEGQSTTLQWEVEGSSLLRIEPGGHSVTALTAWSLTPGTSTRYTLVAQNPLGTDRASLEVDVLPAPPRIHRVWAEPSALLEGQSTWLHWEVSGAQTMTIDPAPLEIQGNRARIQPRATGRVSLTAANPQGQVLATTGVLVHPATGAPTLFPVILPWDDAEASVTDLRSLVRKPADLPIGVDAQGHLLRGPEPIRFWGVNFAFEANFPSREEARALARRLAKYGVNIVRHHHLDMYALPSGLWTSLEPDRQLDPGQLDKLDYLRAQLKENGIYSNLNLLVGRPFHPGSDQPPELAHITDWKLRHVLGFFDPSLRQLQKDYARALLTRVNPYTGLSPAQDPSVAVVEILNENGLLSQFMGGGLDELPAVYGRRLQDLWNGWLLKRYGNQGALRDAWKAVQLPLGSELIRNGLFSQGTTAWVLEQHAGAQATATVESQNPPPGLGQAMGLNVTTIGQEGWHVQFNQPGLSVSAGIPYTLEFWARSESERSFSVAIGQAHSPWQTLGFTQWIPLQPSWRKHVLPISLSEGDSNARLNFGDLGLQKGKLWLAGVSLRPGGSLGLYPEESLANRTIRSFLRNGDSLRTEEGRRDWFRFLLETEEDYWKEMRDFLKQDLGVQALIGGTAGAWTCPSLASILDLADAHAYWQHPEFPGMPWDEHNWFVTNTSMLTEPFGSTLSSLSMQRILGKAFTVSEYNHPAPNTFQVEAFPMAAVYASLQDWNGLYAYSYSHNRNWGQGRIASYFDIVQNPLQMASFPWAATAFHRGDLAPAQKWVVASLDREGEIAYLPRYEWDLGLGTAAVAGALPGEGLIHGLAIAAQGQTMPPDALKPGSTDLAGKIMKSDTGQIHWDRNQSDRPLLWVDAPRSKLVLGYGGGRRVALTGVEVEMGMGLQSGWGLVGLTVLEGSDLSTATRILLSALGTQCNTGARWGAWPETAQNFPPSPGTKLTFLGNDWGSSPSLVEGLGVNLRFPLPPKRIRVRSLDSKGQPFAEVPVEQDGDRSLVRLGPQYQALWYEIRIQ